MPGISRKMTDMAGGLIQDGSSNVFINDAGAVTVGDSVMSHGGAPHSKPTMTGGSSTVFVNGKPVIRAGDKATCQHVAAGSSDVSAG